MILFILGIVVGLLLALLVITFLLRYTPLIKRQIHQLQNLTGLKGQVFEPENEELRDFIDNLPNEKN